MLVTFLEHAVAGAFYGVWIGLIAKTRRDDRQRRQQEAIKAYEAIIRGAFDDMADAWCDLMDATDRGLARSVDVAVLDIGGEPGPCAPRRIVTQ